MEKVYYHWIMNVLRHNDNEDEFLSCNKKVQYLLKTSRFSPCGPLMTTDITQKS